MPLNTLNLVTDWLNANQGLLTLILFVATVLFGWASGIFSSLRRRPKFKIQLLDGPTFCCIYSTGNEANGIPTHQVAFALYLRVSNVGSQASSIEAVKVGYHWNLARFSNQWLKFTIGWFWLDKLSVALEDFQVVIGKSVKVFPFLFQKTYLSQVSQETYLEPGRSAIGVVYFEQPESWGGCQPKTRRGKVPVRIRLDDAFGGAHYHTRSVPLVGLGEARKYNPSFGKTFTNLSGTTLPFDNGN